MRGALFLFELVGPAGLEVDKDRASLARTAGLGAAVFDHLVAV
jgi:hypothetical protein